MRGRHDIPLLKFGRDDKGADAGGREDTPAPGPEADDALDLDARNRRRHELIKKEFHGGGLSRAEEEELAGLQAEFEAIRDKLFPVPEAMLAALEKLADEWEAEGQPK